jgi:hypothetical protein
MPTTTGIPDNCVKGRQQKQSAHLNQLETSVLPCTIEKR